MAFVITSTLVCLELATRGYWTLFRGVPFGGTDLVWKSFYPEWVTSGVESASNTHGEGTLDVLLLGASTLLTDFGDIPARLQINLGARLGQPVRVFNLSYPGRVTLDSRWKYEKLGDKRFDLVIVYHGLNDAYLNNCPPGTFRADYSHAARFAQLAAYAQHKEIAWLVSPFTVRYLFLSFLDRAMLSNRPRREWHHYGADIRTTPYFEDNIEKIVALAGQRGDRLLLMTYAYHIPADYSEAAFAARRLDYGAHISPIALWGSATNVARAVDAHNGAILRIVARHPGLLFVDQKALMPVGKDYFDDICHLTMQGCRRFLDNILKSIEVELLQRGGGSRTLKPLRESTLR